ncbi:MAG: methyltransferase domain-containing protein [Clostridia bacterium]|nr:methyltransferase domain-containing protein [Clostridia bacterium]
MNFFTCPVCKERFSQVGRSLICPNRHCSDLSKRGYVNLLRPSKSGGARHGDDKLMVEARKSFLNAGFYAPLLTAVCDTVRAETGISAVLDAGCGEGYYTQGLRETLTKANPDVRVYGIDVSRDAIHAASLRDRELRLAVASIFDLPIADGSIDILINLFAPYDSAEFSRVLRSHGLLIRVFPAERHLWELKSVVYDTPYENEIDTFLLDGFTLISKTPLAFPLHLDRAEYIDTLFKMTPYYYKTGREGQARLAALPSLDTHAEFYLAVYRRC